MESSCQQAANHHFKILGSSDGNPGGSVGGDCETFESFFNSEETVLAMEMVASGGHPSTSLRLESSFTHLSAGCRSLSERNRKIKHRHTTDSSKERSEEP